MKRGEVKLPDRDILLLRQVSDPDKSDKEKKTERRRLRHRKLNPSYQYPEKARPVTRDEVLKLVRRQLRQPQESTRSRDTTQSRYFCVYQGCGYQIHADENAAINIVRKWINDKSIKLA